MIPFVGKCSILYDELLDVLFDNLDDEHYYMIINKLDDLLIEIVETESKHDK